MKLKYFLNTYNIGKKEVSKQNAVKYLTKSQFRVLTKLENDTSFQGKIFKLREQYSFWYDELIVIKY